jgi:hypothetical protein
MDLRSRLIAPLFRSLDSGKKIFDVDAFVKRTILFDTYIIDSERLTEVPHLIRIFGFDGFLTLFESGFVKLNCYLKTTASLGSNFFLKEAPGNKIRPPFHYSFTAVSTGDLYHNLNLSFQKMEPDLDLTSRQLVRMRKAVYDSLENPQDDSDELSIKNTKSDLILYPDLLAKALVIAIRNQIGIQVNYQDIKINIQYKNDHDFYVASNIQELLGLDVSRVHNIIERACLAVAKRNDRIEHMKIYSALSGFNDIDIPVFVDKLTFLASAISPNLDEERFQRVIEITGLPHLNYIEGVKLNAKKMIEIRQSVEALEFRQWLRNTDNLSDEEIIKQINSLSKTVGRLIGGEVGQNIRFLITNGAGFVPIIGQAVSTSLSILDKFVIDKIFPRSGISAFIDDMYPSIFEK